MTRSCDAAQQAAKVSPLQVGGQPQQDLAASLHAQNPCRRCATLPLAFTVPPSLLPLPPQSWRNLFQRQNLPMTIMSCSLAALQQLTGINAVIFFGEACQRRDPRQGPGRVPACA